MNNDYVDWDDNVDNINHTQDDHNDIIDDDAPSWWCQRHKRCSSMYYAAKWNLRGHSLDFPTNTRSMAFIHIILFDFFVSTIFTHL